METTTIKVSMETRDALRTFGRKGDSYDKIIGRLFAIAGLDTAELANFDRGLVRFAALVKEDAGK